MMHICELSGKTNIVEVYKGLRFLLVGGDGDIESTLRKSLMASGNKWQVGDHNDKK